MESEIRELFCIELINSITQLCVWGLESGLKEILAEQYSTNIWKINVLEIATKIPYLIKPKKGAFK